MKTAVWAVLSIILAASASAQETTGRLEGRVVAEGGAPIGDAQIVVTGPTLQGERHVVTDAHGRFVVRSLPAGSYTADIRHLGSRPLRLQNVPVRLGSTTPLGDLSLPDQALMMTELVVSGAKPVIDPVSTAAGAALDSSQILALPSQRDFRALLPYMPQANASAFPGDGVNIGGSTGLENAFYVDGMHVTSDYAGSMNLPFNFVREIQLATGGYEAEYGRALSGVVNVVTPSGGNDFHGQVLGFFTGSSLSATPRTDPGEASPSDFGQYDLGLSLSGPIRRDRLWYSVAYNPTFGVQHISQAEVPTQRDAQVHHLVAGKVSWSPGPATALTATVLADPFTHDSVGGAWAFPLLSATTDPNTVRLRATGGGTAFSLQVRHQLASRAELEVAISRLDSHTRLWPTGADTSLTAITRIDDYTTNSSSGGYGYHATWHSSRTALRAALSLSRGTHDLKVGVEYEDNRTHTPIAGAFSVILRLSATDYQWFQQEVTGSIRNQVPTAYIQDGWSVTRRLRVNAGVRWEAQHISGSVGPDRTILELAPRLGVVYQPGKPGSRRLFASASRFFEQIPVIGGAFWNMASGWRTRAFAQNPLVDSANGSVSNSAALPDGFPASPDLRGQYYDQLSVGYERRLGYAFKVGVRGTFRTLRWAVEDGKVVVAPGDTLWLMGNPGRGSLAALPRARQRYAALEFSVERSTPGPLYLLASYVLSRNTGNYTGLYATDLLVAAPNSGPQYDVPDLMNRAYGPLPNDRTHVVKVATSYRFRFGATLGGFFTLASGTPRSEYGTSAAGPPYWTFVRPRGTAGRTPTTWSLDLHGAYDLPFARGGRVRPRLVLDVFNVGSPRAALLYDQLHYLDSAGTQVNPNYGAVTRHQPPMSARVGMLVGF
jgi:hypothetical protein